MKAWMKWSLVILAAAAADLAVRFAVPFHLARVLRVEAVLFPAAALALLAIWRREAPAEGWGAVWRPALVLAFLLAGLRAGLWAAGFPVHSANLTALALFAAGAIAHLLRRRRG